MARILLVGNGLYGGLLCTMALACRLRAAGHSIAYAAPASTREVVEHYGFELLEIPRLSLNIRRSLLPSLGRTLSARTLAKRSQRLASGQAKLGANRFAELLRAENPDLVLLDFELHPHIMTAVTQRKRVALYSPLMGALPGLESPPLHRLIVPGRGFRGSRAGVAFEWLVCFAWKLATLSWTALRAWGGDPTSLYWRHAATVGFDRSEIAFWRWQLPWSYRLPTLIFHARELDLPINDTRNLLYVGPMIARNRPGAGLDASLRMLLERLDRERAREGRKLIYASSGSFTPLDDGLAAKLFEAARRKPSWTLLFDTGRGDNFHAPEDVPPNVQFVASPPQLEMLEFADVFVSHCRASSVTESTAAGVPLLGFPPRVIDNPGNAARVAFHNIGRIGHPGDSVDTLVQSIELLITSTEIRDALEAMRRASDRYHETGVAENIVDALLTRNPS